MKCLKRKANFNSCSERYRPPNHHRYRILYVPVIFNIFSQFNALCTPRMLIVKATAQEKKIFKRFAVIHSGLHWRLAETMEIEKNRIKSVVF